MHYLTQLSKDLQRAEEYGDNLRNRLRELDLVQDAIRDSKDLEGRMNGAPAKLWRELEALLVAMAVFLPTGCSGSRSPR